MSLTHLRGTCPHPVQLDKERKCEKEAEALFGAIDGENGDGKLSLVELYNAVSANHINWDIAEIKEAMALFDDDQDGYIDRNEFKRALAAMSTKKTKKKKKAKGSDPPSGLDRGFTFKDHKESLAAAEQAAAKHEADQAAAAVAEAQQKEAAELAEAKSVLDDLTTMPTADQRKRDYWKKMEANEVWQITLGRKHGWNEGDEDALTEAMARARANGKTPLLLDQTPNQKSGFTRLDDYLMRADAAEVLEAKQMFDDRVAEKSHDVIMKGARKQLVEAMKQGKAFYVRLGAQARCVAFTGEKSFNGDDTLPLAIFDAPTVATSLQYTEEAQAKARAHAGSSDAAAAEAQAQENHGLHKSGHALDKVLREPDLDYNGNFFVGAGFSVVAAAQLSEESYKEQLMLNFPLGRMQVIKVRALSYS